MQLRARVKLQARFGTFFVTGNHEYFVDTEAWLRHLPPLGLDVLRRDVRERPGELLDEVPGLQQAHGQPAGRGVQDGPGPGDAARASAARAVEGTTAA